MKENELDQYKGKGENSFNVPDGYFSAKKIDLYKIAKTANKESKVISIWKKNYIWSSAIAALFITGLFFYFYNPTDIHPDLANINDVSADQIEEYLLDEYLYSMDETMIITEIGLENLDEIEFNF